MLDVHEQLANVVGERFGKNDAEVRVQLVDIAKRGDAPVVLVDARAITQAGRPVVAGAGRDLRQTVGHGSAGC